MGLEDWEAYAAAWADPQMTEFIGGKPRTRAESWTKFLASVGYWPLFGYGYWSFIDKQTGDFLGNGGLAQQDRGIADLKDYPEAGWTFVPSAWGRGLATEAMTEILRWSDDVRRLLDVRCIIAPGNAASIGVATKLGFEPMSEFQDQAMHVVVYRRMCLGKNV